VSVVVLSSFGGKLVPPTGLGDHYPKVRVPLNVQVKQ